MHVKGPEQKDKELPSIQNRTKYLSVSHPIPTGFQEQDKEIRSSASE